MPQRRKRRAPWKPIVGLAIAAVLLAFLFATSNVNKVGQDLGRFRSGLLPYIFALLAGRAVVRIVEWRFLLRGLGVQATWKHAVLGMLAGDTAQIVPGGLFMSNLVLKRLEGVSVARSLPATWGMQLLEAMASLLLLAIVGVSGWWWVRIAAVVIGLGLAGFLAMLVWGRAYVAAAAGDGRKRLVSRIAGKVSRFLSGIESLLAPARFGPAFALTVPYLALTFTAFYLIVHGLAIESVGWIQTSVVYAFALVIANLNPLPTDLGISEGSGVSIFLANGVPEADGLSAMIIVRLAIVCSAAILTCLAALVSHREVARFITSGSSEENSYA